MPGDYAARHDQGRQPRYLSKKGAKADQVYFGRVLSKRLKAVYGRPGDARTAVVFDLKSGPSEEIVRRRRRKA